MDEWNFKKNASRSERRAILRALPTVKDGEVKEVSGRRLSKLKLERWQKEMVRRAIHNPSANHSTRVGGNGM
jgi:hypothetical protein